MSKYSYCKIHNTYPANDEPCWSCINEYERKRLESEPEPTEFDWEKVNEITQDDIISMTMDFEHKRATASEIADRIAKRCDIVQTIMQKNIDRLTAELKTTKDELKYCQRLLDIESRP